MSWTTTPGRRGDIVLETYELLDGSGNYASAWLETAGIGTVRVLVSFNGGSPAVRVDDGQFDDSSTTPRIMRSQAIAITSNKGFAELALSARYFRLVIDSGSAENPFAATVRAV